MAISQSLAHSVSGNDTLRMALRTSQGQGTGQDERPRTRIRAEADPPTGRGRAAKAARGVEPSETGVW